MKNVGVSPTAKLLIGFRKAKTPKFLILHFSFFIAFKFFTLCFNVAVACQWDGAIYHKLRGQFLRPPDPQFFCLSLFFVLCLSKALRRVLLSGEYFWKRNFICPKRPFITLFSSRKFIKFPKNTRSETGHNKMVIQQ